MIIHLNQIIRLSKRVSGDERTQAIYTPCSNVLLRLPRVRGLSASMVYQTNLINKEHSYV